MANKKYDLPYSDTMMVFEPAANYGITIPVTVPTMGGYTLEALRNKLTEFARKLVLPQTSQRRIPNMPVGETCLSLTESKRCR